MSAQVIGRDEIDQLTEAGHLDAAQRTFALEIQVHMTLMAKSMVLALSGASLLVMWWLHRTYFAGEAA